MATLIEALERHIEALRARVRHALMAGDRALATSLRRELREAERNWDEALDRMAQDRGGGDDAGGSPAESADGQPALESGVEQLSRLRLVGSDQPRPGALAGGEGGKGGAASPSPPAAGTPPASRPSGGLAGAGGGRGAGSLALPVREQVHQALTLLTVPAAPKLISAVHEAFFAGAIFGAKLTSLRRDEERSFRIAPFARPYYICAALTADLLAAARGLLAVSTWPMEQRVIGPLSPRVDFLTAAIQVAEGIQRVTDPGPAAARLLWRFAVNIPGGTTGTGKVDALTVARAAAAEREIHADADRASRRSAAARARRQLGDAQQFFGTRLRATREVGTGC